MPSLQKNLLSVSKFTEEYKCCFIFYPWGFIIKDLQSGKILLIGPRDEALYRVSSNKSLLPTPVCFHSRKSDAPLWHNKLGHPLSQALKIVAPSLHLPSTLNKHFCGSCKLGKSSKLPFQQCSSYSTTLFSTLHSDVWGPSPVTSVDGYRYYLIIVDECSRFTWIFPLHSKSEVSTIFISFIQLIKRHYNALVRVIQSDGGGEYISGTFQAFLKTEGISHLNKMVSLNENIDTLWRPV